MSLRVVSSLVFFLVTAIVGVGAQSPAAVPTSPQGQAPAPNFKKLTRAENGTLAKIAPPPPGSRRGGAGAAPAAAPTSSSAHWTP